jgi:hypothetical protein
MRIGKDTNLHIKLRCRNRDGAYIILEKNVLSMNRTNFPFFSDLGYNENVAIGRRKKALVHIEKKVFSSEKAPYKK